MLRSKSERQAYLQVPSKSELPLKGRTATQIELGAILTE